MNLKKILVVLAGSIFILSGCTAEKTDLEKLQGEWAGEEGGIIFYGPNEEGEVSGDAEVISEDGEVEEAEYEWHESSQRIIISHTDGWGDTVKITYRYEIVDDTELNLTPVKVSDSVNTVTYDDKEAVIFEKIETEE